ncbi:DNA transposition protein [uncultured Rhodospira sp.]|uniref:DNA transposition protein n=1 Tax=uncultured Rhodospira sp. TaxID=1936189 RepID=UPI00262384F2|nr:DNA transposition protein [uncultured Rhodospira sp.]
MKDRADARTLDLLDDWTAPDVTVHYDGDTAPRGPDLDQRIAQAVSRTLSDDGRSREEIAEAMGAVLGHRMPKNTLDGYAAPSRGDHAISLARAIALMEVTGDVRVVAQELRRLGYAVIPDRYLGAVEEAMTAEQIEHLEAKRKIARRAWRGGHR